MSSHKIYSPLFDPISVIHSLNPVFRLSSCQCLAQWHSYFLLNVGNILTGTIYYFSCFSYSVYDMLMTRRGMFFSSEIPEHFPLCCVQLMNSLISSLISLHVRDMHLSYETTFHFQHFSYCYNSFFVFQCLSDASQPCIISKDSHFQSQTTQ